MWLGLLATMQQTGICIPALFLNERDYFVSKIIATVVAVTGLSFIFLGKL